MYARLIDRFVESIFSLDGRIMPERHDGKIIVADGIESRKNFRVFSREKEKKTGVKHDRVW